MSIGPWRDLEDRRGRVEQHRENASRPGRAFAHYTSTGLGKKVEATVFPFGTAFTELPIFTFGTTVDEDSELLSDLPVCSAIVYKWRRTANGFYTGAWVAFGVQPLFGSTSLTAADWAGMALVWSLAWEGVASKDFISTPEFPVNLLDI